MEERALHPENALAPMVWTVEGIVMDVNEEHPAKADALMSVTADDIITLLRAVHPEKAPTPMEVTVLGMVMLVNEVQPANA